MPMKMYEDWALVATIDPIDANNADSSTDIIDMKNFSELLFLIMLGVMNDSATNTVTVYSDSAAAMGSEVAISGKAQAITGADTDAKQYVIRVGEEELTPGHRYVRATMANSSHSQLTAIAVFGKCKYPPATDHDLSTVQTVVD